MSYGSNQAESFRLLGSYVARILKGEKAADRPEVPLIAAGWWRERNWDPTFSK
jgi:hypothetical protein